MTEIDPHTVINSTLPATIEEYGDGQTIRSRQVIIDLADHTDGLGGARQRHRRRRRKRKRRSALPVLPDEALDDDGAIDYGEPGVGRAHRSRPPRRPRPGWSPLPRPATSAARARRRCTAGVPGSRHRSRRPSAGSTGRSWRFRRDCRPGRRTRRNGAAPCPHRPARLGSEPIPVRQPPRNRFALRESGPARIVAGAAAVQVVESSKS